MQTILVLLKGKFEYIQSRLPAEDLPWRGLQNVRVRRVLVLAGYCYLPLLYANPMYCA